MRQKTSTKNRILDTAAALFGERGIHGVSTADIACKAHVNKAMIFYYFGSKEELYRAVFKKWLADLKTAMEAGLDGVEPGLGMIEMFVRTHFEFLQEHRNMPGILIRELLINDKRRSPLFQDMAELFGHFGKSFLVALATARKRGEIRDVDPIQTLVNIISLDIFFFLGIPILNLINPSINSEEFRKSRVDHVLDLLMNGLRKQPE